MSASLALLLVFLGIIVGLAVGVWLAEPPDDAELDAELDAIHAADRLFEVSEEAHRDMKKAVRDAAEPGIDEAP